MKGVCCATRKMKEKQETLDMHIRDPRGGWVQRWPWLLRRKT